MNLALSRKTVPWIVASIVLGALGSGFWDLALKPLFLWSSDVALNIVTFGMQRLKDAIYVDIAKGLHEQASMATLSGAVGALVGISVALFFIKRPKEPKTDEYKKRLLLAFRFTAVFTTVLLTFLISRQAYVNRAISYFNQLDNIVAPFLVDSERLKYRSEFSQIRTAGEYKELVERLQKIAVERKQHVPQFYAFD